MKKTIVLLIVMGVCLGRPLAAQETLKYLKMEEPAEGKGKNRLWVDARQVEAIVAEVNRENLAAVIEIAGLDGTPLAVLGKVEKGNIKWEHKLVNEHFLPTEFAKENFADIAEKLKNKAARPGLLLQVSDNLTRALVKRFEISFVELPDLEISMQYPTRLVLGQEIRQAISLKISNKGTQTARDISLDLALSSDNQVPLKSPPASENFQEDMALAGGRQRLAELAPGQSQTVVLDAVTLAADIPPGKYYLVALVDADNKVSEISKDNNMDLGMVLISVPEPKSLAVDLPDTRLVFEPANLPTSFLFRIFCGDLALSDGKDWKFCRMKPYVYQLRHVQWKDMHWEVNTLDGKVWEIHSVQFCKGGGTEKDLKIKVEVRGGSETMPPTQVTLRLVKTQLVYHPPERKFNLVSYDQAIDYPLFWRVCKLESHLYQFRYVLWSDFFWQVDTFKKQVSRMSGVELCKVGGTASPLPFTVQVEK